jgi:hypothetical protein
MGNLSAFHHMVKAQHAHKHPELFLIAHGNVPENPLILCLPKMLLF